MKSATSTPSGKPRLTTSAMIASIAADGQKTKPAPFGHALVELARNRSDVIGMTADLGKYTDLHIFAKEFPDRFYQMGMAEQLLFGAASGLAAEGFTPFATTYAVFASRRAYDFIHQTIAEVAGPDEPAGGPGRARLQLGQEVDLQVGRTGPPVGCSTVLADHTADRIDPRAKTAASAEATARGSLLAADSHRRATDHPMRGHATQSALGHRPTRPDQSFTRS